MPAPLPLKDDDPAMIGGYRLIGRLGEGGQGTVYLAEPAQGEARVAIKTLSPEGLDDPRVRQRFVREAEAARQVASFCTAAVLAADFEVETPYIVSEYVEGQSLGQRVRQDGPMAGGDLTRLAVATTTALVAIHEAGIVHRDVKPGNVLLGDGGARVIDFGIAQITEGTGTLTNSTIGTPAFMAPEQIISGNATPASDVFAWGVTLAFAATGASPFDGGTVPNVLHNVLHNEPDLSVLPGELRPLVVAALAKDPAARPSSVDVLMTLLGRQGRPTDAAGLNQAMREAHTAVADGTGAPPATFPPTRTTPYGGPSARTSNRATPWLVGIGAVLVAGVLMVAVVTGAVLGNVLESTESGEGNNEGGSGPQSSGDGGGGAEPEGGGSSSPQADSGGSEDTDDTEAPVEGSKSVYYAEVGDCYNESPEASTTEFLIVDCAEPHDAEVYALVQLDSDREWPGQSTINSEAKTECRGDVFESYIGIDYPSSMYHVWYYTPTESSWADGDYEVVCSAYDPNGKITGSVAGSGR